MAILGNFEVKHIRPIGQQGYDTFCSDQMIDFLSRLGFNPADIARIFAAWRTAALADPYADSGAFVRSANVVAQARWDELYPTDKSTLMFLDADQLVSLSNIQLAPNSEFSWQAPTPLEICVTIHRDSNRHHIIWDATGFTGATDANGMISHFAGLIV
ncbi:hypothetical protein [Rhizobium sp. CNPSo 3490]|uniref:hypothetical protein n=1 Tax=Rhizobium sp. CNPSo 3490 TaxID=3021407 RepID=UPI002550250F|nr:hypothetical protein [Rhizobium sp. CNPSo 3490]MDK4734786.1 hypothetical protein [Rhizobium sp. CNPSo 3490]